MEASKTNKTPFSGVIVIGRQTGSGGRKIGRKLANLLGIDYFDRELLGECAASLGYSPEVFEMADEKRPSLFRAFMPQHAGLNDTSPMNAERLYKAQSDVIRRIASIKPAVFVGRSADYILRSHDNLTSVFIHAPEERRARNLMERGAAKSVKEAHDMMRKTDNQRQNFYNYFTPGGWGKAENYHLCIDSSKFSLDAIANLIAEMAKGEPGA